MLQIVRGRSFRPPKRKAEKVEEPKTKEKEEENPWLSENPWVPHLPSPPMVHCAVAW